MEAPEVFRELEWQVARVRRATERFAQREEETIGAGRALLDHAVRDLDKAVDAWREAGEHAHG